MDRDWQRLKGAAAGPWARQVWDAGLVAQRCEHVLRGHESAVNAVAIADGGMTVVSGGLDGTVRKWRLTDGKALATGCADGGGILTLTLLANGMHLVTGARPFGRSVRKIRSGDPFGRSVREIGREIGALRVWASLSHCGRQQI